MVVIQHYQQHHQHYQHYGIEKEDDEMQLLLMICFVLFFSSTPTAHAFGLTQLPSNHLKLQPTSPPWLELLSPPFNNHPTRTAPYVKQAQVPLPFLTTFFRFFRPPDNYPMFYCVSVGSGVQLAVTILLPIVFSVMPLVFYMLPGIIAGNVSSLLYKPFKGRL